MNQADKAEKEVSYTCPVCGAQATATFRELSRDYVSCSVCHVKHEGATLRERLKHELKEFEQAYIEYLETVEL
jgi:transcription elongation factor Elf1